MSHEDALELAAGYVLGALEPAEEAAVREHLLTCPLSHDEFAELGGVVPYLAETVEQVEPPPALRDRIMAAAAADLAARATAGRPAATPGPAIPFPSATERAERAERTQARTSPLTWIVRIAAVVAIVALGGWNLLLQGQLDRGQRYDRAVAEVTAAAGQPGGRAVILSPGKDSSANGIAAVRADGSVILAMRDLPATTGAEVYETWVIVGDAPTAVGGFTVDSNGIATFTTRPADAPAGAVIAVTREPKAGNTAPQGPVVSAGAALAPST